MRISFVFHGLIKNILLKGGEMHTVSYIIVRACVIWNFELPPYHVTHRNKGLLEHLRLEKRHTTCV